MAVSVEDEIDQDVHLSMFEQADVIEFEPPLVIAVIPGDTTNNPFVPEAYVSSANPFPLNENGEKPTYLDLAALDHCFINKSDFVSYTPKKRFGTSALANKGGFDILGEGKVIKEFNEGIGKLDDLGFMVTFGRGKGIVAGPTGEFAVRHNDNQMYELGRSISFNGKPAALATASADLATWHRHLCYCDDKKILQMHTFDLVEGLKLTSRHASAGGAYYGMILTDTETKVKDGFFLKNKESVTIIAAFETYRKKFENQTGKKIK
ncbi:hypothetical protein C8J56DRAFT_892228 [Mycena floridula]|nr:hypothetical protein C8J56DRAFT_892228 [Mycena floridula]